MEKREVIEGNVAGSDNGVGATTVVTTNEVVEEVAADQRTKKDDKSFANLEQNLQSIMGLPKAQKDPNHSITASQAQGMTSGEACDVGADPGPSEAAGGSDSPSKANRFSISPVPPKADGTRPSELPLASKDIAAGECITNQVKTFKQVCCLLFS